MAPIRAGQGLLTGLLRCGRCGRKLHVRYWGKSGTAARYVCKGEYDAGGEVCLGFGGSTVDKRFGVELLEVLSPLGVAASLLAITRLVAEGVLPKEQVVPWAPWEIRRADLDSPRIRCILDRLRETGKLVLGGDHLQDQGQLFQ